MCKTIQWFIALLMFSLAQLAFAQSVFVYPAKGQSSQQQQQDQFECYSWAKANTGYDPSKPQTVTMASGPAPAQQQSGGAARGALGGMLLGAVVGDSDDAARGAIVGGLFGGIRQSRTNQQAKQQQQQYYQQQQQQQASQIAAQQSNYNRAYAACLEGRGYTVK